MVYKYELRSRVMQRTFMRCNNKVCALTTTECCLEPKNTLIAESCSHLRNASSYVTLIQESHHFYPVYIHLYLYAKTAQNVAGIF